jgi:serine acetyltransferase
LGNKYEGDKSSRPTIGDNVSLGANVVIIGDIVIGDNVIVGAGSVVTKSVPNNSVVVGNPARLLRQINL